MDVCGLNDLGYEGRSWTYEKKVVGGAYCRVRLDRALATTDWINRFPEATLCHLTAAASDHSPIVLSWRRQHGRPKGKRSKGLFRYELMWESHDNFSSALSQSWQEEGSASTLQELQRKLAAISATLNDWGMNTFGHVRVEAAKR